jgi:flagellar protein FlbD
VFALNSDLIERVDSTPDTIITMIDGAKYLVSETLQEVVDAVKAYRGELIAASAHLPTGTGEPEPGEARRLTAVPVVHRPDHHAEA